MSSYYLFTVSTPLLISFIEESYHLSGLFIGPLLTLGVRCSAPVNPSACSIQPFFIDKLRDFFGLNFIVHHGIKASRRVSISYVSSSLQHIMFLSSMNAFRGGIEHPPCLIFL
ncbi:hypothetical protein ElyMa_000511500 [Elysia marginata]|uniref:Uncharacterized protein n=1 Tax=Elysia marginata TaxID=1093978 RepID=A0AAV4FWE1_9GAST|nr:hypothetical protein ElyMa_000511500 [Elysia marginata]